MQIGFGRAATYSAIVPGKARGRGDATRGLLCVCVLGGWKGGGVLEDGEMQVARCCGVLKDGLVIGDLWAFVVVGG